MTSRKWSIPASLIKNNQLVLPNKHEIVFHDDFTFAGTQGGYVGVSQHGNRLHVGTPSFALAQQFIEGMQQLQEQFPKDIIPLPTMVGREGGPTREEAALQLIVYCEDHDIAIAHDARRLIKRLEDTLPIRRDLKIVEEVSIIDTILDGELFIVKVPHIGGGGNCWGNIHYSYRAINLSNYQHALNDLGPWGEQLTRILTYYDREMEWLTSNENTDLTHYLHGWVADKDPDQLKCQTKKGAFLYYVGKKLAYSWHAYKIPTDQLAQYRIFLNPPLGRGYHPVHIRYEVTVPNTYGAVGQGFKISGIYLYIEGELILFFANPIEILNDFACSPSEVDIASTLLDESTLYM